MAHSQTTPPDMVADLVSKMVVTAHVKLLAVEHAIHIGCIVALVGAAAACFVAMARHSAMSADMDDHEAAATAAWTASAGFVDTAKGMLATARATADKADTLDVYRVGSDGTPMLEDPQTGTRVWFRPGDTSARHGPTIAVSRIGSPLGIELFTSGVATEGLRASTGKAGFPISDGYVNVLVPSS